MLIDRVASGDINAEKLKKEVEDLNKIMNASFEKEKLPINVYCSSCYEKQDEHKVVFKMISSQNNLNIMPDMISSSGYYQLENERDSCRVEYFQECEFKSGLLKSIYINNAKKQAIKFLYVFKRYLEGACH